MLTVAAMLAAIMSATMAQARDSQWALLGEIQVGFQNEREVVRVNRDDSWYRAIRLDVQGKNVVFVRNLRVVYLNGFAETINVDRAIRPGERSDAIDLGAERSFIQQFEIEVRAEQRYRGGAVVQVYGDVARQNERRVLSRARTDEFKTVSDARVNLRDDRVVLDAGRRAGPVSAIRINSRDNPVYVRRVEIVFGNGTRQSEDIQQLVGDGRPSRAIDLQGDRRLVREVTVDLRPQPSRRSATVVLEASDEPDRTPDRPAISRVGSALVGRPPRLDSRGAPDGYQLIDTQTVGRRGDRDVFQVGDERGQFDRIAIRVLNNDVLLERVTIVYGDGDREPIDIGQVIQANTVTSTLKMRGDRFVKQIELDYRKSGPGRGQATVELYGEYSDGWNRRRRDRDRGAAAPAAGAGWVLLGKEQAAMFNNDSDVFRVGRERGRFRALALVARRRTINVRSVKVFYGNGTSEELSIPDSELRDGESSDAIDLQGRERVIDRVEVVHRSKIGFKGPGELEIWGLAADTKFDGERDGRSGDVLKRELGRALKNLFKN